MNGFIKNLAEQEIQDVNKAFSFIDKTIRVLIERFNLKDTDIKYDTGRSIFIIQLNGMLAVINHSGPTVNMEIRKVDKTSLNEIQVGTLSMNSKSNEFISSYALNLITKPEFEYISNIMWEITNEILHPTDDAKAVDDVDDTNTNE